MKEMGEKRNFFRALAPPCVLMQRYFASEHAVVFVVLICGRRVRCLVLQKHETDSRDRFLRLDDWPADEHPFSFHSRLDPSDTTLDPQTTGSMDKRTSQLVR